MKFNKKRLVVVAPLSSLSKRTRLFKLVKFVNSQKGYNTVLHIGWERSENERIESGFNFDIDKKIILEGGGYGGNKVKWMYFLWIFSVFFQSFRLKKEDIVWALGFESAFPLLLGSKLIGYKVYFDDADRFSMLFNFPAPLSYIISKLEELTSKNVYKHVIPGVERYNFKSSKFFVLKNMPSEDIISAAIKNFVPEDYITNKIVINVNGWLGDGRGMTTVLSIAECFKSDVSVILAGKIDSKDAEKLSKLDNVQYLGQINNQKALESYLASDFVLTYYDPKSSINRYAESNKWGDAIKLGIGVIVNQEVETAKYLNEAGATIMAPYYQDSVLIEKISQVLKDQTKHHYKDKAKSLADKYGYFEEQLNNLI